MDLNHSSMCAFSKAWRMLSVLHRTLKRSCKKNQFLNSIYKCFPGDGIDAEISYENEQRMLPVGTYEWSKEYWATGEF